MKYTVTLDLKGTITKEIEATDEADAKQKFLEALDMGDDVLQRCAPLTASPILEVHDAARAGQSVFKSG